MLSEGSRVGRNPAGNMVGVLFINIYTTQSGFDPGSVREIILPMSLFPLIVFMPNTDSV